MYFKSEGEKYQKYTYIFLDGQKCFQLVNKHQFTNLKISANPSRKKAIYISNCNIYIYQTAENQRPRKNIKKS